MKRLAVTCVVVIICAGLLLLGKQQNKPELPNQAAHYHHHDGSGEHGHHHNSHDDPYYHHGDLTKSSGGGKPPPSEVSAFDLGGWLVSPAFAAEGKAPIPDELIWKHRGDLSQIDDSIRPGLTLLHGGSAEDPKTGVIYTCFPGAGLYYLEPDLVQWKPVVGADPEFKKANSHGICVFEFNGNTKLGIASTNTGTVYITSLSGVIEWKLTHPKGTEFNDPFVNAYYANRIRAEYGLKKAIEVYGAKRDQDRKPVIDENGQQVPNGPTFVPTCVTELDGTLYVSTGYSTGDFILTATNPHIDAGWAWGRSGEEPNAWGRKREGEHPHDTAHGVVARKNPSGRGDEISTASRENWKVYTTTTSGKHLETLHLPNGARACNIAHSNGLLFVPLLDPVATEGEKTASVVVYNGQDRIGRLNPAEHGVAPFPHVHHVCVVLRKGAMGDKTHFAIVQGWNQGNIAIFEAVKREVGKKR